jgi:hypothetical protein
MLIWTVWGVMNNLSCGHELFLNFKKKKFYEHYFPAVEVFNALLGSKWDMYLHTNVASLVKAWHFFCGTLVKMEGLTDTANSRNGGTSFSFKTQMKKVIYFVFWQINLQNWLKLNKGFFFVKKSSMEAFPCFSPCKNGAAFIPKHVRKNRFTKCWENDGVVQSIQNPYSESLHSSCRQVGASFWIAITEGKKCFRFILITSQNLSLETDKDPLQASHVITSENKERRER